MNRSASIFTVAGVAATVLIGGCGSSKSTSSSGNAGTVPSPGAASRPAAGGTAVAVTETEFKITMTPSTLKPGSYTFNVHNNGTIQHNLTINGPGVSDAASPTMQPGQTGTVSVTLQAGRYEFFCSVDSHKEQGMDITMTVA